MRLLITGSSGYIGSVLCKLAKERGHFVLGADTVVPKHNYCDEFVHDDIERNSVAYEATKLKVEAVFHLAASADVTHSTKRPSLYYHNNIGSTSKLFDNMIMMGFNGAVVFSSTASVYGFKDKPCVEDDELKPETAYGKSKLVCEEYFRELWIRHGIPSVSFRYFNVAGAYGDVGDHFNSDHVLQKICKSAQNGFPFYIYGDDYSTADGTCVRDYIHVLDVCLAHFTAIGVLRYFYNKCPYVFNLGTGNGISVKELVTRFTANTGKTLDIKIGKTRPGDPAFLVANSSRFTDLTMFKYENSNIDNIIKSAWEWRLKNAV